MDRYDSVTEVISVFSGIDKIPSTVLQEAAARGTAVHQMVQAHYLGLSCPPMPEKYIEYYKGFESWKTKNTLEIDWMETRFFSEKLLLTGKPDIFTKDKWLIDIKTGSSIQRSWPVQLAGYNILLAENGIIPVKSFVLFLQKGKDARLLEYKISEYTDVFLSCLKLFRYFNKKTKKENYDFFA